MDERFGEPGVPVLGPVLDCLWEGGGGGQSRHPNGSTFFDSPQTRGCVCAASQRVRGCGFPARPSARELAPRPHPGAAPELWFLSCPCGGVRSRIPPGGPAPRGAETATFTGKVYFGSRLVNSHEDGAPSLEICDCRENMRFGLKWGSGAISVPEDMVPP